MMMMKSLFVDKFIEQEPRLQEFKEALLCNANRMDFDTYLASRPEGVAADESEEEARENFDRIDTDGDGEITADEVMTFIRTMLIKEGVMPEKDEVPHW